MKPCEEYQINLSAMMDGELSTEELTETVKHVAVCTDCLQVMQQFQNLQQHLCAEIIAPSAPADLWQQIKDEAAPARKAKFIPLQTRWVRYISMAAVFVLFFGMGYLLKTPTITTLQGGMPVSMKNASSPIVLASDAGKMTDEHFLELTRELLSANPVYHRKMYLILQALNKDGGEEGHQNLQDDNSSSTANLMPVVDSNSKVTFRF
jgi:hypothetical protein